jgi:hypothetical protein
VVILTDDQRHDELAHMPTVMRRLAGEGLQFVNSFVTTPLCCPSRAGDPHETENLLFVSPEDPSVQRIAERMRRRRVELRGAVTYDA